MEKGKENFDLNPNFFFLNNEKSSYSPSFQGSWNDHW